ncbi:MAG TPA: hypothetical protein VLF67_01230 [Candidatus Saccharimonas sp.]|nr:hypothetical protein [Candidatus Saccharimonas sp.]
MPEPLPHPGIDHGGAGEAANEYSLLGEEPFDAELTIEIARPPELTDEQKARVDDITRELAKAEYNGPRSSRVIPLREELRALGAPAARYMLAKYAQTKISDDVLGINLCATTENTGEIADQFARSGGLFGSLGRAAERVATARLIELIRPAMDSLIQGALSSDDDMEALYSGIQLAACAQRKPQTQTREPG